MPDFGPGKVLHSHATINGKGFLAGVALRVRGHVILLAIGAGGDCAQDVRSACHSAFEARSTSLAELRQVSKLKASEALLEVYKQLDLHRVQKLDL